jgi:hypothetical protein
MEFYPADDDGPLCRLMDDPAYWAEVLADNDDRQAVKRAVKRLPNRGGLGLNVIKVERDDVMGRATHALMKTPHGREMLHHELMKRLEDYESVPDDMIAQAMFQSLTRKEDWFKPLEDHLVEDKARDLRFLTPDGFAAYLEAAGAPSEPDRQRWLASMVAAFARVSPDRRVQLLQALIELGPPYDAWFSLPA